MARATRIALDIALSTSKTLKTLVGTAWQYAKVEMIPPMTASIFQGATGAKLENTVGGAADGFINSVQNKIKDIEAEEARAIREKEAALKAAAEQAKAKALKKVEEQKRLDAEKAAKKAKEAEKKTKEAAKAEVAAKAKDAKKREEKPKPVAAKKEEKKPKPKDKKDSPPAKK